MHASVIVMLLISNKLRMINDDKQHTYTIVYLDCLVTLSGNFVRTLAYVRSDATMAANF